MHMIAEAHLHLRHKYKVRSAHVRIRYMPYSVRVATETEMTVWFTINSSCCGVGAVSICMIWGVFPGLGDLLLLYTDPAQISRSGTLGSTARKWATVVDHDLFRLLGRESWMCFVVIYVWFLPFPAAHARFGGQKWSEFCSICFSAARNTGKEIPHCPDM